MKKFLSAMLVLTMIISFGGAIFVSGADEAQITSPGNGNWLDPYEKITVKWTEASGDADYQITIKNERTGNYVVQNKKVSGTSYTISSNTLDFEERYTIWVGTYDGSTSRGFGHSITIYVNDRLSSKKVYNEAEITYPSNKEKISAESDLNIRLNGNSDLAYKVSVKDITKNKTILDTTTTSTTITLKKSLLTPGNEYKVWVGTYKKASEGKKDLGPGKTATFTVKEKEASEPPKAPEDEPEETEEESKPPVRYSAAKITTPSDKEWLNPSKKITIKWDKQVSGLEYKVSVEDEKTGKYFVKNKSTSGASYSIDANTLPEQQLYKITLTTYNGSQVIGRDEVLFYTEDVVYTEAGFASLSNGDVIDPTKENVIRFSNVQSGFSYKITIVGEDGKDVVRNKETGSNSYTVKANTLKPGKNYTIWLGTFLESDTSVSVGAGKTIKISTTEEAEPEEYDAAKISSPKNGEWLDPTKSITIKWNKPASGMSYVLSIQDDTTGEYIVKDKKVTSTSYTINANTLEEEQRYKITLTSLLNDVPQGYDQLCFNTNDVEHPQAEISSPADGSEIDPTKKTTISLSNIKSGYYYCISVVEADSGISVVKNKKITGSTYTINANQLEKGTRYKIWVGTYLDSRLGKSAGGGNVIYVSTKKDEEKIDGFYDVPKSHKNYNAIMNLTKKGVVAGDGTGYFRPEDTITRAEFVKMVCESFALKKKGNPKTFKDTSKHWAKDYIDIVSSMGIVNGVSDSEFAPNSNLTYQQIAKIIVVQKGWESTAEKLNGYPDGYVKVMIANDLFDNTAMESDSFKGSSYYKANATRADVAQIVYNAMKHSGKDKTDVDAELKKGQVVTKITPYVVTGDLGEDVIGTDNPSMQQVYNYVYNMLKDRDVYKKDPNVLNAVMAMIWTENKGVHYKNGKISSSSNSSSVDYGICQLNSKVYPEAKNWGWEKNLETGVNKYATHYWMCMGEEEGHKIYAESVENALACGAASTYQDARARSAYSMYNYNNDNRERWFRENDNRDSNYYEYYVNKPWAKSLTETGKEVPKETQSTTSIKYDGKTYTYVKNSNTSYEIGTKSYATDDFANVQDVWKLFYGYNPTFTDNNPLCGRLEWYCPGIGSLFVEYDMRNVPVDNVYQFDICRFTQDGVEFLLPEEYIGYNMILNNKLTMTKHGDVALIGVKNLANVFACDINYKNEIRPNNTMQKNLQKVTDALEKNQSEKVAIYDVQKENSPVVFSQSDNRWGGHTYGKTIAKSGCGLLAITNAVYYLNGQFINPKFIAEYSISKGFITSGGSDARLYSEFSKEYGEKYGFVESAKTTKISKVKEHLSKGGTSIVGTFSGTSSLHIMAVVDYRISADGKDEFLVLDSSVSTNRFGASYGWITIEQADGAITKVVDKESYSYYSKGYFGEKEICFGNFRLIEKTGEDIKINSDCIDAGGWVNAQKDLVLNWETASENYYRYAIATMQYIGATGNNSVDKYESTVEYEADRLYKNMGVYGKHKNVLFKTGSGIMFPAGTFNKNAAYKIWVGQYEGPGANARLVKSGYIYIFT